MAKSEIIFFGNERLATGLPPADSVVLKALLEAGYPIPAVITRSVDAKAESGVETLAREHTIPILRPTSREELEQALEPYTATVGVLVAFGLIVPQNVIGRFKHGILNIHPSLLPSYRGSAPIEQAILNGDEQTGVSIMSLEAKMDTGPVYAQSELELQGTEAKTELAATLLRKGAELLIANLGSILEGDAPTPQNEAEATYSQRITKHDGTIDWSKPAVRLEREVRAFAGWPGSRTELYGRDVAITAAHVIDGSTHIDLPSGEPYRLHDQLSVVCGDGQLLAIDRLKPAGKRDMGVAEFLRGLRQ